MFCKSCILCVIEVLCVLPGCCVPAEAPIEVFPAVQETRKAAQHILQRPLTQLAIADRSPALRFPGLGPR